MPNRSMNTAVTSSIYRLWKPPMLSGLVEKPPVPAVAQACSRAS